MTPEKVRIWAVSLAGGRGYDLEVVAEDATLQDYLQAVNRLIEEESLDRTWSPTAGRCYGCHSCCHERVPLTSIDLTQLQQVEPQPELWHCSLARWAWITVRGQEVDITLRREESCSLLDTKRGICCHYLWRPLVCQTFICAPASRRATRLREVVANQGMDQLVRDWLVDAARRGVQPLAQDVWDSDLHLADWPPTPMADMTSYEQVAISQVVSERLWRELTQRKQQGAE